MLHSFWGAEVLGNTVGDWTLALTAFLITFTVLPLVRGFIAARRRRWSESGRGQPIAIETAALLAERTSRLFIWAVAVYVACALLSLPVHVERGVEVGTILVFWFQMGLWGMAAVRHALERRRLRSGV